MSASMPVSEPTPRRLGRSILAVFVGTVVVVAFSLGTDELLRLAKIFPPVQVRMSDKLFALATAYRLVYGVLGSFITARLAPYRPMLHSIIGGAIGTAVGFLGVIVNAAHPEMGPLWYSTALAVTAIPCAWIGAKLSTMNR